MLGNSGKMLPMRAVASGEFSEIASLSELSASIAVSVCADVANGFNCITLVEPPYVGKLVHQERRYPQNIPE